MVNRVSKDTASQARGKRARRVGVVKSDKGHKTITVEHMYTARHPKYEKYIRRHTRMHAHDEKNEARIGDHVEVESCRRMSKTKMWRLVRIISRAAE